jgi:hypothetical protein
MGGHDCVRGTRGRHDDQPQGAITNNAAVTFDQAANGTYAGAMSGTGALTKSGAGTVTLSGQQLFGWHYGDGGHAAG